MRILQNVIVVSLVVLGATTAWAQFGLYGSPEILRLPQAAPAAHPVGGYVSPSAYPVAGEPYSGPAATAYMMPSAHATFTGRQGTIPAAPAPPAAPGGPVMTAGPSPSDQTFSDPAPSEPGCLTRAVEGFEQAVCGGGGCAPETCCPWYGSAYALYMGRNAANRLWTTALNEVNLQNSDMSLSWRWGGEIRFGRRFCCDQWALEATYWTLDAFEGRSSVAAAGLITPLDFTLATRAVTFGGVLATNWFDGADEHRLRRYNEFHNVELNLIRNRVFMTSQLPWDVDWSVGVRFFRFEENLVFSSLRGGGSWAVPADAAYLDDQITNNLIGLQFGFDANYYFRPAWRFFFTPKFGIYNNAINHDFRLYLGDGTNGDVRDPATGAILDTFPARSSTNTVSFLTQVDLGTEWQFAPQWSARMGYRVVVVTGVGLADNQIPPFITDVHEIVSIETNGELILHGAFFGLTYNF